MSKNTSLRLPSTLLGPKEETITGNKESTGQPAGQDQAVNNPVITKELRRFFNGATGGKKVTSDKKKKSGEQYASFLLDVERRDLEKLAKILETYPVKPGRILPNKTKEDLVREAIKRYIKSELKRLKKAGKIK